MDWRRHCEGKLNVMRSEKNKRDEKRRVGGRDMGELTDGGVSKKDTLFLRHLNYQPQMLLKNMGRIF